MLVQNKLFRLVAISTCLFIAGVASCQAEEAKKNQTATPGMQNKTPAMQKAMDPNVWSNMMAMMVDPEKAMSLESCAQCHEGEDLARYQKDFGPMMEAMKPMMSMMNPHMMSSMMNPMMGMMNPMMGMMNPMMGMMNPMMGMMNPMMGMMNPMMGMMNPMMGMMNPMMGMMGPMMNPMGMMGPMMNPMGMMGPMSGGMGGMMNPMSMMYPMMGMMGPMSGGMGGMGGVHGGNPMGQMPGGQMMDPKQYEQWFSQWTETMKNFTPQAQSQAKQKK